MMEDRPVDIERETDFWNLCWQSVDIYRFLTPVGRCRNLRCVADRVKECDVTFEELADPYARQDLVRNVEWFKPCVAIANNFDWARFGASPSSENAIRLRYTNYVERREVPGAMWSIAEGVHRTLVAAVLLDQRRIRWQSFSAVTSEPDT